MTKAVLAKTDRQITVTHNSSSVGFGNPTAMLAKTSRHIEYIFASVGIWDTTAMLAKTVGPFVMTNAMLAKTNGHISENGFWMPKSSAC
ncbi:MAG: hypothetical protein E7491_07835 [Ruminococcaceae bacterium]|nr:hypothetical protein [Oscillospiraceae bacterium]